jgi:hypothetical protein
VLFAQLMQLNKALLRKCACIGTMAQVSGYVSCARCKVVDFFHYDLKTLTLVYNWALLLLLEIQRRSRGIMESALVLILLTKCIYYNIQYYVHILYIFNIKIIAM